MRVCMCVCVVHLVSNLLQANVQKSITKKKQPQKHTHHTITWEESIQELLTDILSWKTKDLIEYNPLTHTHTPMSGTAAEMTAENLGRLLGLFAQRCRLPAAAVEEEDAASGEDEEGDGQKRGRQKGERKREEAAWGEYREGGPCA